MFIPIILKDIRNKFDRIFKIYMGVISIYIMIFGIQNILNQFRSILNLDIPRVETHQISHNANLFLV